MSLSGGYGRTGRYPEAPMKTILLTINFVLLLSLLAVTVVHAEEQPCRYSADKQTVICNAEGFRILTTKLIDAQGEAKSCSIRLKTAEQAAAESTDALRRCVEYVPPVEAPKSKLDPRLSFALTVLGTAALVAAPLTDWSASNRVLLASGGLLTVFGGYWLLPTEE